MPLVNNILFDAGTNFFDPAIFDTANHYVEDAIAETITVVENFSGGLSSLRTINEGGYTIFDAGNFFPLFDPAIFDTSSHSTFAVSDALLGSKITFETLSESISVSDLVQELASLFRTILETETISDVVSSSAIQIRSIVEPSSAMFDQAIFDFNIFDTTISPILVIDAMSSSSSFVRTLPETVLESDVQTTILSANRSIPETVTISDDVSSVSNFLRTLSDSISTSDFVSTTSQFFRTISETSVSVIDVLARVIIRTIKVLEPNVTVSDRVNAFVPPLRLFIETRLLRTLSGWITRIKRTAP